MARGCEDPSSGFIPPQWFIENNHPIYIDRVSQVHFALSLSKGASTLRAQPLSAATSCGPWTTSSASAACSPIRRKP
jgi:hypothetical protein